MLDSLRARIAAWIAPGRGRRATRAYATAAQSRLTAGWTGSDTSADGELHGNLKTLRNRSRALVRDASYAKRARQLVVNNVVGTGIGMQAQVRSTRGRLFARVNDEIESAWSEWCRATSAHTGGVLHFADLERAAMAQVFEAGEVFIRKHLRPFGDSKVPLALELIEAERLVDEYLIPGLNDGRTRMGIERDEFGRPLAFWIREKHPGDSGLVARDSDRIVRVPADQMIHLYVADRWPQTRGEPWLHTAAKRLHDMDGYSEAEIVAARGAASYMGIIESPDPADVALGASAQGTDAGASQLQAELTPGIIQHLAPGEKFTSFAPNRPNPNMDPFMRLMLREVAAGVGVSYESLSRDYSQSNYSSSRLALLDDRDVWRTLQQWFVRAFREPLHRVWLQQAVLAGAIPSITAEAYLLDRAKFEAVSFKPRGWSWVDPTKEVAAYKEAVMAGFTTVSDVIAQTAGGLDIEDVLQARRRELDLMESLGISVDTSVPYSDPDSETTPPDMSSDDSETTARVVSLRG